MAVKKPKLNDIPLSELNEEISARAGILASEMVKSPDDHIVRHPYSRMRVQAKNDEPSMTHQSHAESCDINNIIRQFDRTGLLPPPKRPGQYADVTALNKDLTELYSDMEDISSRIRQAQEALAQKQKEAEAVETAAKTSPSPAVPEAAASLSTTTPSGQNTNTV